ncbi:MAG: hypothetical protein CM15mV130_230 [Caudoviricetes sp.]|nr:MAG: hypothetical protein CM15mV130_230 [Caudoviricetes sp.]
MSLRQQWNIADPSMVEDDNQILSMCGIFGEDHTRFKSNMKLETLVKKFLSLIWN